MFVAIDSFMNQNKVIYRIVFLPLSEQIDGLFT